MSRVLPRILTTLASFTLLGAVAAAGDDLEAQNPLLRPPGAPDSDASGHIRAEIDLDKNRHRLKIEAEHIDTSLAFQAWMADADGVLQFVGTMPFDAVGEVEIHFDSQGGPALPFGATAVGQLANRAVEVRVGGVLYLYGTVPALGGSGGGGGGSGGGNVLEVKQFLTRAPGSPDSNVSGYVELRKKSDGDQKFKVEADHIDPSIAFAVWLETAAGSGVLQSVGAMGFEDVDEVELEIETEDGAALPFGATDVAQLAGRRVEVRDGTNAVYLEGLVPSISGGPASAPDQTQGTIPGTIVGSVKLKLEAKKNYDRFELEAKKLKGFAAANVFLANDASQLVLVKQIGLGGGGNGKFKVDTKKGQPLPLGVLDVKALAGRAIELRDATTGAVLATGTVPSF